MSGWKYEWVEELPQEIHTVLVEMLNAEADARENR